MRWLLLMLLTFGSTYSVVNFSHSALYDIYDLQVAQLPVPKCNLGCHIYAATLGDAFYNYPDHVDPYARNVYIRNNANASDLISLVDLAQQKDWLKRKLPLIINDRSDISVVNMNSVLDQGAFPIVLYVVEKSTANSMSYEVYDVMDVKGANLHPQSLTVTMLSAQDAYTLQSAGSAEHNKVKVRLAGFDNAFDNNPDGCDVIFETSGLRFPGFTIQPNTPLISIEIDNSDLLTFETSISFNYERDLTVQGFITSPGWNGCRNTHSGGVQTYRSPSYSPTDSFALVSSSSNLEAHISVTPHFDSKHNLTIDDGKSLVTVTGTEQQDFYYKHGVILNVTYENMRGDQGFLLKYSKIVPFTTPKPVSSTLPTPVVTKDNYCNCALVNGAIDGWNPSDIWVDLIIIIDTSAAMSDKLEEAKSMVTSFVSLMGTDTTSEFYSRIGVIAASAFGETIYNLNMTSSDNLEAVKQSNVGKMDFARALQAALKMFSDGKKQPSYRSNAKQIVYFLTKSSPIGIVDGLDYFKRRGIVMVNDFLSQGQVVDDSLKQLASDNFFFTNMSDNYLNNLAVLCEANCFCDPLEFPFNDDKLSPRTQANRGCFQPFGDANPQQKARENCQQLGGALVSIHDQPKEYFVNSVTSEFGNRQKYWLALQYDGNVWNWDDQSTDPFSDWDAKQPDTNGGRLQCAYATQKAGLTVKWTAADCAMGGVIYVCESAPCSTGNKYC